MIELISKYLVVYQDDQQIQLLRGSFLGLAVHVEVAKRNELRDCWKSYSLGEMFTIMRVLLSPVMYSCRVWVSLQLRKGMWDRLLTIELITNPSWVKDVLMNSASFFLSPSTMLFSMFSLPAKSISVKEPTLFFEPLELFKMMVKRRWDLEECSLHLVTPTFRFSSPCLSNDIISSSSLTSYSFSASVSTPDTRSLSLSL